MLHPLRNVNHSINYYGNEKKKEILLLEIWTNISLTPQERFANKKNKKGILFKDIFIDQLNLSSRT